jgi:hypothetical protein
MLSLQSILLKMTGVKMKAAEKPETIIIIWFVVCAAILFVLTLKFPYYDLSMRATAAILLTTPFAIRALHSVIKMSQLQTENYLSLK